MAIEVVTFDVKVMQDIDLMAFLSYQHYCAIIAAGLIKELSGYRYCPNVQQDTSHHKAYQQFSQLIDQRIVQLSQMAGWRRKNTAELTRFGGVTKLEGDLKFAMTGG